MWTFEVSALEAVSGTGSAISHLSQPSLNFCLRKPLFSVPPPTSTLTIFFKMSNPFVVLSIYSVAIITMPIIVFFGTKQIAEATVTNEGNIYGAVAAVIAVHVVLFAFVYKAFQEEKALAKEQAQKKE